MAALAPSMAGLSEPRQQLLLLTITLVNRFKGEGLDAAEDRDVADAAQALSATYDTAARGLIYEHRPSSIPAQRLATEIRTVFDQLGRQRPSAFAAEAAEVLRRLELQVNASGKAAGGARRAFLDLAARVARLLQPEGEPDAVSEAPPTSPIILP